ncbi:MAG: HU family DNA-binding protein [Prevotellaceae bacterium]|nr:HU family DNA-binding protein [Prevotellaceae bacterium]
MSKPYKVRAHKVGFGDPNGQVVYSVFPVSFGTLTTEDAAKQISEESSLTTGDVKNVLDRYAHYVVQNLRQGYNIELLGFGRLYLRFINKHSVGSRAEADASLVSRIVPAFRPSYKFIGHKERRYDLIPEKIQLERLPDSGKDGMSGGEAGDASAGK